jgi:coniferyl-aldehyde dehydrogenase
MSPLAVMLEKQRAAFLRDGAPTLRQRRADLLKLKQAVAARRTQFAAAVRADFGNRAAQETTLMDLIPVVQAINYQRRHLGAWMAPARRQVSAPFLPGRARVTYQPLGVIGIISPWNFPVALSLMPLATAIAAGNRAMIKPSEFTPATSAVMAAMLAELFPEEQVAVVTGQADIGAAFSALAFDHLLFTGSTGVGRAVMKAASQNLVPLTLELGGKSPVIIEQGYSLERAARAIAFGKLANAGQTCIAPDYVLVHETDLESFLAAYVAAARQLYPGGFTPPAYTSIINAQHRSRLMALLEDARGKGARIVELDAPAAQASQQQGLVAPTVVAPTVVLGATDDMRLMREEIFGPILPLLAYRTIDDAIDTVNARPRPLALYFFGPKGPARRDVLQRTTSGNVTINDTLLHFVQEDLPFGGVGPSGMGAYHGVEGFRALSHAKGVFEQARWNFSGSVRPPFGALAKLVINLLLR